MQAWLARWRRPAAADAGSEHDPSLLPGMLGEGQLEWLQTLNGTQFDRGFLTMMGTHHGGAVELAEQVFGMPVKLGVPKGFGGLVDSVATPVHATGVGLVQYGVMRSSQTRESETFVQNGDRFREILRKMSDWVKQYV